MREETPCIGGPPPLALPAIGFAAGVALARMGEPNLPALALFAAIAAAGAILPARPALSRAATAALFAAAGAAWTLAAVRCGPAENVRRAGDEPVLARLSGVALETPAAMAPARDGAARARFLADFDRRRWDAAWVAAAFRARVTVSSPAALPAAGGRFEATGFLSPPRRASNPEGFDFRARMIDEGVAAMLSVPDGTLLSPRPGGRSAPVARLRARMLEGIRRRIPGRPGALVENLLLGERTAFDPSLRFDLARTGTLHLLAISGTHLALLASFLAIAFRVAPLRRRATLAGVVALLLVYTLVVGDQPSVLRSFAMAAALGLSTFLGRRRDPANALSLALLAVLALDPPSLLEPGMQLSFAAVAALLWGTPPIRAAIDRRLPAADPSDPPPRRLARAGLRAALLSAGASAACSIVTAPILLWHFHMISPATIPMNLLALPIVGLMMGAGFCFLALDLAGLPGPALLAPLLSLLAEAFEWLVRAGAKVPFAAVFVPDPGPAAWVLGLAGAAAVAWRAWRGRTLRPAVLGTLLAGAALCGVSPLSPPPARLAILDAGEGHCALLETGRGGTVLFDAGSASMDDAAAYAIAPLLFGRGVRRVDLLVLSGPFPARAGAIEGLAERVCVRACLVSARLASEPGGAALLARLDRLGIPVLEGSAGDEILRIPGARVRVLSPAPGGPAGPGGPLLVSAACGGRTILLGGEARDGRLEGIPPSDLESDVLILPRGGRGLAAPEALLGSVRPRLAVASNPDRLVTRAVRAACARARVPLWTTGGDGAVLLEWPARGGEGRVEGYASGRTAGMR